MRTRPVCSRPLAARRAARCSRHGYLAGLHGQAAPTFPPAELPLPRGDAEHRGGRPRRARLDRQPGRRGRVAAGRPVPQLGAPPVRRGGQPQRRAARRWANRGDRGGRLRAPVPFRRAASPSVCRGSGWRRSPKRATARRFTPGGKRIPTVGAELAAFVAGAAAAGALQGDGRSPPRRPHGRAARLPEPARGRGLRATRTRRSPRPNRPRSPLDEEAFRWRDRAASTEEVATMRRDAIRLVGS